MLLRKIGSNCLRFPLGGLAVLGLMMGHMMQSFAPLRAKNSHRRFATVRAVLALMLREMATTYGRSPGGYLWAVLEPVGGIAILTLIFSFSFNQPALGVNFPIFYATGVLPFMMFNSVCNRVSTALLFSKALLAYPAVTFVDALLARFLVNTVTQAMVGYVVFGGILMMYDTRTLPAPVLIAQSFALTAVLALGIGTLNAYLIARFAVWQMIWSILTRPLFLISGIFFLYGAMPHAMRDVIWFNPLIHVVGIMRAGFYPTYNADYTSMAYVLLIALASFAGGLVLLRRSHRDLLGD
jgi:capsular polysaccharide transport system permease protein